VVSENRTPFWRDPLFSPGDRFPLGPPRGVFDDCREGPSELATRPFSLRGVVAGGRLDEPPAWCYTYCPDRQIAFVHGENGSLTPLLKHTKPGATPGQTSGGGDGQGPTPPPEEVSNPDWQSS